MDLQSIKVVSASLEVLEANTSTGRIEIISQSI